MLIGEIECKREIEEGIYIQSHKVNDSDGEK